MAARRRAFESLEPGFTAPPKVRRRASPRVIQEIMREKALARYTKLICGHYATKELQEVVSCWNPKDGRLFCETCNQWVERIPPPIRKEIPLEPEF